MKELALKIRLVDEVSSAMNNIGDSGTKVIAGLENGFVNVSSEISHTSKAAAEASASIAKLSGDVTETVTQSRLLANAAENQANKLEHPQKKLVRKRIPIHRRHLRQENSMKDYKSNFCLWTK